MSGPSSFHRPLAQSRSTVPAQKLCQRCLKSGHFTFECKNERKYVSRPSRTAMIANPALREKMRMSAPGAPGSLDVTKRAGVADAILNSPSKKRRGLSRSSSSSSSEDDEDSSSDSDSNSDASSTSSSSSSSSSSSESESDSDSDSDSGSESSESSSSDSDSD